MEARLYVGNLSYTTSEDDLRALFAQAGPVVSAAVITEGGRQVEAYALAAPAG